MKKSRLKKAILRLFPPPPPGSVYRYFSEAGDLLYVGVTKNILVRDKGHKTSSSWYYDAHFLVEEFFDNWMDAKKYEAIVIKKENPIHNINHSGRKIMSDNTDTSNKLFDLIIRMHKLKNDAALARMLGFTPAAISKVRHKRLSISAQMVIDVHLKTDMAVRDILALVD